MKLDKAQLLLDEQPISIDVLLEKYAKGDEKTVDEVRRRVARGLAHVEKPELRDAWEKKFYDAMVTASSLAAASTPPRAPASPPR